MTWTPTPAQVHAVIPARVNGAGFTATSIPTTAQVTDIVARVVALIGTSCGPISGRLESMALETACIGAATAVERGFFPEQQDQSNNASVLQQRYDELLDALRREASADHLDMMTLAEEDSYLTPYWPVW